MAVALKTIVAVRFFLLQVGLVALLISCPLLCGMHIRLQHHNNNVLLLSCDCLRACVRASFQNKWINEYIHISISSRKALLLHLLVELSIIHRVAFPLSPVRLDIFDPVLLAIQGPTILSLDHSQLFELLLALALSFVD